MGFPIPTLTHARFVRRAAKFALTVAISVPVFLVGAAHTFAEDGTSAIDSGDTAWMLTATALVLLMTIPGLVLFYGGMVRKKNVLATVMQSFASVCLISLLWVIVGYSIAFGEGNAFWGGLDRVLLLDMGVDTMSGTIPESVFMTFQMTFAIITPILMTGAFIDRMKFSALLIFNTAWVLLVYAPIAHWVWGGGFLGDAGVLDFAGGTVVHINAGVAGLVAAIFIGKRVRYGTELFAPHSLVLSVVGASFLWVGWFGFNAGSAVAANGAAGMAMAVTQIAAAAGGLTWMFMEWGLRGKPSALGLISGAVAGLVAITPAAGYVAPFSAIIIGIAAGACCYWAVTTLKRMAGYDDSLDAFGVHGIGGIVGAILTGVFASEAIGGTPGVIEGNVAQLLPQIYGVAATVVYCGVVTFIILKVIDVVIGLRVDERVEAVGLDISLHGERGYEL
ncbi:MAG: ammonium transporter [Proteobacteria bacterium]|nr:MAG: ammonium transporter [Pseudomonadota bacterium]